MYLGVHGKFTDRLGDLLDCNHCRPLRNLTRFRIVKYTIRLIQSIFKPHAGDTPHHGSLTHTRENQRNQNYSSVLLGCLIEAVTVNTSDRLPLAHFIAS
jgi:hypothetical protein